MLSEFIISPYLTLGVMKLYWCGEWRGNFLGLEQFSRKIKGFQFFCFCKIRVVYPIECFSLFMILLSSHYIFYSLRFLLTISWSLTFAWFPVIRDVSRILPKAADCQQKVPDFKFLAPKLFQARLRKKTQARVTRKQNRGGKWRDERKNEIVRENGKIRSRKSEVWAEDPKKIPQFGNIKGRRYNEIWRKGWFSEK